MDPEIEGLLHRRFRIPEPAQDRRRILAQAIAENVRPGDAVHLGQTHVRHSAGTWELLRQFHGASPGFTLISWQCSSPVAPLVHAGLARKVVTSWAGDSFEAPGPNPVYERARQAGVEFEHWSLLTYTQRLAAAARGQAWATTRSLVGSTMAEENADAFREVEPGLGLVSALVPDVSILHAAAADASGNVLLTPPLMEGVYGAMAARRGVIVTVERVVEPDVIRRHSGCARIPASAVRAVVEAPFGGHPGGLFGRDVEGIPSYGEDYELWIEIRRASRDPGLLDAWIKEWVLEPASHEAYLERLGEERLERLRARARPDAWRAEVEQVLEAVDYDAECSAIEVAIVTAARLLAQKIEVNGYRHMLAGAGMANLAAWLAALSLGERGIPVDLVAEMGLFGYVPSPGEPYIFNQRNFPSCTMLGDIEGALGIVIGGSRARSIGSLGAAQVDRSGNINSTLVDGRLLTGSGGANDVATCASESLVTTVQAPGRLVERVPYVTAPGGRVRTLVTTAGVYEKDGDELVLTAVYGDDIDAAVREARATCGWDLRVARGVRAVEAPGREELRTLRLMDPHAWYRR